MSVPFLRTPSTSRSTSRRMRTPRSARRLQEAVRYGLGLDEVMQDGDLVVERLKAGAHQFVGLVNFFLQAGGGLLKGNVLVLELFGMRAVFFSQLKFELGDLFFEFLRALLERGVR